LFLLHVILAIRGHTKHVQLLLKGDVVGLLLASTATLEGMEEVKQEDLGLEDLNSTQEHLMV